jgi:hypothetical protein
VAPVPPPAGHPVQDAIQGILFGVPILILVTLPLWIWTWNISLALYLAIRNKDAAHPYHQQDPGGAI